MTLEEHRGRGRPLSSTAGIQEQQQEEKASCSKEKDLHAVLPGDRNDLQFEGARRHFDLYFLTYFLAKQTLADGRIHRDLA